MKMRYQNVHKTVCCHCGYIHLLYTVYMQNTTGQCSAYLEVRKTVDGWMNRQTWAKRKSFKI